MRHRLTESDCILGVVSWSTGERELVSEILNNEPVYNAIFAREAKDCSCCSVHGEDVALRDARCGIGNSINASEAGGHV
jgi:hypothetical protein